MVIFARKFEQRARTSGAHVPPLAPTPLKGLAPHASRAQDRFLFFGCRHLDDAPRAQAPFFFGCRHPRRAGAARFACPGFLFFGCRHLDDFPPWRVRPFPTRPDAGGPTVRATGREWGSCRPPCFKKTWGSEFPPPSKSRSDSIRFNPIRSDSIRFDPTRSDSIRFNPIQSDSIRFDPIQSVVLGSARYYLGSAR